MPPGRPAARDTWRRPLARSAQALDGRGQVQDELGAVVVDLVRGHADLLAVVATAEGRGSSHACRHAPLQRGTPWLAHRLSPVRPRQSRRPGMHRIRLSSLRSPPPCTARAAPAPKPKGAERLQLVDYIAGDTLANFEHETGIRSATTATTPTGSLRQAGGGHSGCLSSCPRIRAQQIGRPVPQIDRAQLTHSGQPSIGPARATRQRSARAASTRSTGCGATSRWASNRPRSSALAHRPADARPWSLLFDPAYGSRLRAAA